MTNRGTGPQQEPEKDLEQMELSETWRELLGQRINSIPGKQPGGTGEVANLGDIPEGEKAIPTLKSDPWSTLIQAKGVEIVDLHNARLQISDQEVERILKLMQEYPTQDDEGSSSRQQRPGYDHKD